ncbi:carbon-nitrogen hydrolase family protein [Pseudomonas rhizosphaerae]|uniref:Acyltransferase n=1 Tax=Pseudomonas rhizosphaerae TaxID=216142 RepID=A0A089YID1_9PSED|nr:carbon-nitrogen hydrolase family protein [Pseudomonas rhizosphaerae]AIS16148.1 acyltransferase [Pseudomonas rhizosphaerae]MEB2871272.1 carbon-nitrogen hydrolase family protein [Pseudomonas rhizosphaerae]
MKLIAAQIRPVPGDCEANIAKHMAAIQQAANLGANLVLFPELSLTGYEPRLADTLAMDTSDSRLDEFQQLSDRYGMLIAVGAPTQGREGIEISMISFQPGQPRTCYSKQLLHADELPFFAAGSRKLVLNHADVVLAPAICYESLQPSHAQEAAQSGAQVYLASVAKSERGTALANEHYPMIAKKHSMTVLMANCVGAADDCVAAGCSAVWNRQGEIVCSADAVQEALVAYDMQTGEASIFSLV